MAVDANGGERGCEPAVRAAIELTGQCDVLLFGDPDEISGSVDQRLPESVTVRPAAKAVAMGDDPVRVVRDARDSSIMLAADAVAAGDADVLVTPGNTGAAVLAATVRFGRVPGVAHPALAVTVPRPFGDAPAIMLDVGATISCKAEWLVQFADLGAEYHRARLGTAAPRVGLLSNGSEDGKGGPVRAEAHRALCTRDDYVGLVEGHSLLTTDADVVVTDGFTGNVALKTFEGVATVTTRALIEASRRTPAVSEADRSQWLTSLTDVMYVDGGAALLGLRRLCVICHGASTSRDLRSAIELAVMCWERQLVEAVARRVERPPTPVTVS